MTHIASVIVPCYNQAQYLNESLQSVLDQTYQNWECIIVDDGSPDNTEEVAKVWCEKDSRFRYVKKENGGLSSARNFGIENCSGDFILPFDADDILESSFIEKSIKILLNDAKIGVVSCFVKHFGSVDYIWEPLGGALINFLLQNNTIGCSMFKKDIWLSIGGYDEEMKKGFEDWDFWIRTTALDWNIYIIPEILYFYRRTGNSMYDNSSKLHEELFSYIIKKNICIYEKNIIQLCLHSENKIRNLNTKVNEYKNWEASLKSTLAYKLVKKFSIIVKLIKH